MNESVMRLPLPEPDDSSPMDWYPGDDDPRGLPGVLTETSYTLPEGLNIGEWLGIGETLQRMERSVMWWIGDWWNYGERRYGEMASQAAKDAVRDATGHAFNTVRAAGYVSSRFESDSRLSDVPWSYHQSTAALPTEDALDLLETAKRESWNRNEIRDQAKERKTVIAVEAALAQPSPDPLNVPWNVRVEVADARSLPLDDESVHLIVTSPPYGVGRPYAGEGDVAAGDWQSFMHDWLLESFRVAAPNGRLALNVPLDTSKGGFRPTYSHAVTMAEMAGWEYRSTIVWFDDQLGKSTARGSMDSAAAPYIYAGAEMIALFSKGDWKRETDARSDLDHQQWLDWTNGVWKFGGETQAWEGHPAPFPFELPRRLIRLLSFPGDVVLDPFAGSGTTVLAAAQLQRQAVGFDRSSQYVASALRRIVKRGVAA